MQEEQIAYAFPKNINMKGNTNNLFSEIWIRVVGSVSYETNRYAKGTSKIEEKELIILVSKNK